MENTHTTLEVITDASPDVAALDAATGELVREARASAQMVTNAELDDVSRTNQLVGMARHAKAMENTNRVSWLLSMDRLKKSGSYKNIPMQNTKGEMVRPRNFVELCEAMGTSRATVDRDLDQLAYFGEKLMEDQKNLGISDRSLRSLRAGIEELPESEQKNAKDRLTQAVESGDKTAVRELLEDLVDEKKALAKKLADAKKATKAAEDRSAVLETQRDEKSKKANELALQLEQALNPSGEDERQQNLNAARATMREQLDGECNALVGLVATLCNHIGNTRRADTEGTPLGEPIIDAEMWEHINARVVLAFDSMRGLVMAAGLDWYAPEYAEPDYAPQAGDTDPDEHSQQ